MKAENARSPFYMYDFSITSDYRLSQKEQKELLQLLCNSFPGYFNYRLYYKNVPTFRLLVKKNDLLIGQACIDYRVIRSLNNGPLQIFGIGDLCVANDFQHKQIGMRSLSTLENLALEGKIDALVLFADDHRLYRKVGFENERVTCRFMAVEDMSSICILDKEMSDCFMVKKLKLGLDFKNDHLDMLGHLF